MHRFITSHFHFFTYFLLFTSASFAQYATPLNMQDMHPEDMKVGAQQTAIYFPLLKAKSVAFVGNQTSTIGITHVVDTLLALKVNLKKIFFPEHGFRGNEDAGEQLKTYKDKKTGLTCISLYGKEHKKPKADDLKDVDVVIFDIQDVGARFYTYISTLHYVMEACAENNKELIVLDRPNPNGYFVDGPVLDPKFSSFTGMHPVPIVHGMTMGEYARMINGEKWLANGAQCKLVVVPIESYTHNDLYQLPIKPSPNLPNMSSVYMYPSLCLLEGTIVSVGRGTDKPFQQFGYPQLVSGNTKFTPRPVKGASENPMYKGQLCNGYDVSPYGEAYVKYSKKVYLFWVMNLYNTSVSKDKFFTPYFNLLAGNDILQKQIVEGTSEDEIRRSWEPGLVKFKAIRKNYLIYKDFE
jgi:uncharacterized protein YbbC (DUF1343 family)